MRITRDVPGSRLTLEGDAPRIPPGAPSAVLFVVCLPFFGYTLWTLPAVFAEGAELSQMLAALGLSLFWFSLFFATGRAMRQRGRWPTGVDADRAAGELRLRESRYLGGPPSRRGRSGPVRKNVAMDRSISVTTSTWGQPGRSMIGDCSPARSASPTSIPTTGGDGGAPGRP